jgi:hypothetical protein
MNLKSEQLLNLSHLEFRKKVIEGLIGNVRNKRLEREEGQVQQILTTV